MGKNFDSATGNRVGRLSTVRKAVIPAAGLGSRFLPFTKAVPKEMIPIIDVPAIQLNVEEAVRSGVREIILITARSKEAIENHFDYNYELENYLDQRARSDLADLSRTAGRLCQLISIRQKVPLGLGHAILCAEPVIGREPFGILLGDELVDSQVPCLGQLMKIYERAQHSVIGLAEVAADQVDKYGIVSGQQLVSGEIEITDLVEKPSLSEAPSRLAITGRYLLNATIFDCLRETQADQRGEIQLTEGLRKLVRREKLLGYQFQGERFDTGDRLGFIDATLAYGLKRPELAAGVRLLLEKHLTGQK